MVDCSSFLRAVEEIRALISSRDEIILNKQTVLERDARILDRLVFLPACDSRDLITEFASVPTTIFSTHAEENTRDTMCQYLIKILGEAERKPYSTLRSYLGAEIAFTLHLHEADECLKQHYRGRGLCLARRSVHTGPRDHEHVLVKFLPGSLEAFNFLANSYTDSAALSQYCNDTLWSAEALCFAKHFQAPDTELEILSTSPLRVCATIIAHRRVGNDRHFTTLLRAILDDKKSTTLTDHLRALELMVSYISLNQDILSNDHDLVAALARGLNWLDLPTKNNPGCELKAYRKALRRGYDNMGCTGYHWIPQHPMAHASLTWVPHATVGEEVAKDGLMQSIFFNALALTIDAGLEYDGESRRFTVKRDDDFEMLSGIHLDIHT